MRFALAGRAGIIPDSLEKAKVALTVEGERSSQ
jgi:hypothetical protein